MELTLPSKRVLRYPKAELFYDEEFDSWSFTFLDASGGGDRMYHERKGKGAFGGLILENTFTSLPDVAAFHDPWLPVRILMRNRLDSLSKIGSYHGPLLQCHGDADQIVPFAIGRKLFEAANEPKWFVHLAGHDHNDPLPREYLLALDEFIAGLP